MKKTIKNITVISLSIIFLFTANGIFFIKHFCTKEKTPEIVFFQAKKKDCCKLLENGCNIQKNNLSYCSCKKVSKTKYFYTTKGIKEKCCTYSYFFIKIINPYFKTTIKQYQPNSVLINAYVYINNFNYNFSDEIAAISRPPPIILPFNLLTNILRV